MARAGDELLNPATGLRTRFETAPTTSGELLQVDWIGDPDWTTGPDHLHPYQEERLEVLSGELGLLRVAGAEWHNGGDDTRPLDRALPAPMNFAWPPGPFLSRVPQRQSMRRAS